MARGTELESLAEELGSPLAGWSAVGWGDAQATSRVALADGRVVAARRIAGAAGVRDAERMAAVMARLATGGIPVPRATVIERPGSVAWLVTPWIEGDSGAAWLDSGDRARHLAARMGELAPRLATVDPAGLGLDTRASTDAEIAELGRRQLQSLPVDHATRVAVEPRLELLAAQSDRPPVFAHGDFAPVNVVIDANGEVAAVLDLEHARLAPPGADAAWWGWVVRHHHPEAWTAAWPGFLAASAIDAGRDEARLAALTLGQLLDRAATAPDVAACDRWLRLLRVTAAAHGPEADVRETHG